ncbi:MAG: thiamine-phosphate kinase [Elusimicrobia bacterium]|nr:thiamine-phosphate kinase [Elusimicrobiota bacterium]
MPSRKRDSISSLGERGLLRRIYARFSRTCPGVIIGPGDDAAALRVPASRALVASQDDLVENTHFERRWASPERLAGHLLAINLSDLAAMGEVRPLGCLVSAGLPRSLPASWALRLLAGLDRAAKRAGVAVLGGNLARSERIFLSMCILGAARADRLIRRSGARPGELLCGVGPLGEASAGVSLMRSGQPPKNHPLVRAFWEVRPQLKAGRCLAGLATSMLDNSDGLARSAEILAEESGVRIRVRMGEAPASRPLRLFCLARRLDLRLHQFKGGEDYGLIFTARRRDWPGLKRLLPQAYRLGGVEKGRGVVLEGTRRAPRSLFEHF